MPLPLQLPTTPTMDDFNVFMRHFRSDSGGPTLGEASDALWGVCDEWFNLGRVLGLPYRTLQVIEGRAVS